MGQLQTDAVPQQVFIESDWLPVVYDARGFELHEYLDLEESDPINKRKQNNPPPIFV